MSGARWIILGDGDFQVASAAGPLPTGRALRILKEARKRGHGPKAVRVIQVDVAVQPVDLDAAIAALEARPIGS